VTNYDTVEDLEINYLLKKRHVRIKNYTKLDRQIKLFGEKVLGKLNFQLLSLCHLGVFWKAGIAKIFLDDLEAMYVENIDDIQIQKKPPWMLRKYMLVTALLGNLSGALDLVSQEINLAYDLQFDERVSFRDIRKEISKSRNRIKRGIFRNRDIDLAGLIKVFDSYADELETLLRYRNFFEHRRPPLVMLAISRVASGTYTYDFLSGVPRFYDEKGNQVPDYEARIICEKLGGRKKLRKMRYRYPVGIVFVNDSFHILRRMLVPKRDKLDLLPSELHNEDFEWIDVLQLCKDLYRNVLEFLGATYAVLLSKFKNLIKTKT